MNNVAGHPDVPSETRGVTIERDAHSQQFVIIANRVARDPRLHNSARGLLLYILSLPTDTRVTADMLAENCADGRDAIRTMIHELEKYGYVTRQKGQDERGRWWTRLIVRETPTTEIPSSVRPATTRVSAGRTDDGLTDAGKPGAKDLKDLDLKNEDLKNHHQGEPESDSYSRTAPPDPDDDLANMIMKELKTQHNVDTTGEEARHAVRVILGRPGAQRPTSSPARWAKAVVAREQDITALLPARPKAPAPPRGTCGQCDPRTAWYLDDHGYPDPQRPCPTCIPRTSRRGSVPIHRPEPADDEIMQPLHAALDALRQRIAA